MYGEEPDVHSGTQIVCCDHRFCYMILNTQSCMQVQYVPKNVNRSTGTIRYGYIQ